LSASAIIAQQGQVAQVARWLATLKASAACASWTVGEKWKTRIKRRFIAKTTLCLFLNYILSCTLT
jgi:hypothetical protein